MTGGGRHGFPVLQPIGFSELTEWDVCRSEHRAVGRPNVEQERAAEFILETLCARPIAWADLLAMADSYSLSCGTLNLVRAQLVKDKRISQVGAAVFMLVCLVLVGVAAWFTHAWPLMLARLADPRFAVELAATAMTGITGIAAAFMLAVPDRRREWALLPLPFLALCLLSSGYGCYRSWLVTGTRGLELDPSADCFMFIIGFSIPLSAGLWLVLKRSAAWLDPVRTTASAGIGVAALAAAALQFWHPFDVTVTDLAAHSAAVTIVCTAVITSARRAFPVAQHS